LGSAAFYKGVSEGDVVEGVKPNGNGFDLRFSRDGKTYQLFLRPQSLTAESPSEKKADEYLQNMEKAIDEARKTRQKIAEDENASPEKKKKAEEEAKKNISTAKVGDRAVEASEIAKTKSNAITQAEYPNCWFEASVAAVAEMPNGHEYLANMMIKTSPTSFRITFPGDKKCVNVFLDELDQFAVHDKAMWARLLDAACLKKYPGNEGVDNSTGIAVLTGMPTHFINPSAGGGGLRDVLADITSHKKPAIIGTLPDLRIGTLVSNHAYTLMGYDKNTGVVTIRNPWNGDPILMNKGDMNKAEPITEPHGVRELGDGVLQVQLDVVAENFDGIVWADLPPASVPHAEAK
jgi:chromatin remodeling complex protein RSC6